MTAAGGKRQNKYRGAVTSLTASSQKPERPENNKS